MNTDQEVQDMKQSKTQMFRKETEGSFVKLKFEFRAGEQNQTQIFLK